MSTTNPNDPAQPCKVRVRYDLHVGELKEFPGLTKRELFAKDFMAALLSNPEYDVSDGNTERDACSMADALIKKLNETKG